MTISITYITEWFTSFMAMILTNENRVFVVHSKSAQGCCWKTIEEMVLKLSQQLSWVQVTHCAQCYQILRWKVLWLGRSAMECTRYLPGKTSDW